MSENYKILIVDDEPRNVEILKVKLESEGYQTLLAEDAESAIFAFEQHLPDMVLLDVMMPGVDGREVCKALKERSGNVFIPIILVTAMTSAEAKNEGFAAGADDYITKPVDFNELIARIRNLKRLQGMAHQSQKRNIEHPTYQTGSAPADEVYKVLADGMGAPQRTMYRIVSGGRKAYVGIEGHKFVHARTDTAEGRAALDEVLLWPAESYESVVMSIVRPNVDATFDEVAAWWMERLDIWRLMQEKLPPKETKLVANAARAAEAGALRPVLDLFAEGLSLDQAVRVSAADPVETLRQAAELFYRGLLLRVGPAAPSARYTGAPLKLAGPAAAPAPAPAPAAPAPAPAPVNTAELDEAKRRIEELNVEVLSLNASNDSLREENAELRLRNDGDQKRIAELIAVGSSAEAYRQELESLRAKSAADEKRIAELQEAADAASMLARENDELRDRSEADKKRVAEVTAELSKLHYEVETLKSQPKAPADGGSDALRKSLAEKDKEVSALANQMIAATARNEMQASRIQELQTRIANLERQAQQPKAPADVLKLQSSLIESDEELGRLRGQVKIEADRAAALEARVKELEQSRANAGDALSAESLRRDLAEAEQTIAKLRAEVAAAEAPINLEEEHEVDPATGLAKPDDSSPEARSLKQALRQRDAEIVSLREQILAAAREHESQAFMVDELNRLMEDQRRDYERRLAEAVRNMTSVPD